MRTRPPPPKPGVLRVAPVGGVRSAPPCGLRQDGLVASHQLDGDALAAVRHRGGHLQIIASAGSGKTEVVSQRVAELLAGPGVEVCVVGDDDQAIYQWRGSDVGNIVSFAERYPNVATFEITTNRRSRLGIIDTANAFAGTIPGRIDKTMAAHRGPSGGSDIAVWRAEDEQRETGWVAEMVLDLNERGVPYRDIAVLVRGRAAYRRLVDTFATFDIPVQPGGRTGLFDQPEAQVLGRTFAWMTDVEWRPVRGPGALVEESALLDEYQSTFGLDGPARNRLRRLLREWSDAVPRKDRSADLVGELYELLAELNVRSWDLSDPLAVNRLGTLARFTALLADYESVRRRAPARRGHPRRAGRRAGPGRLVLPEPGHPHRQLRPGRLRKLRRRGGSGAGRRRFHHRPPGQGPGVAGRLHPLDDRRPLPDHPHRPGPRTGSCPAPCSTPTGTRAATPTSAGCSTWPSPVPVTGCRCPATRG